MLQLPAAPAMPLNPQRMSSNPYAPPGAIVSDVATPTPAPARKPAAVWLVQALELALGALPGTEIVQAVRDAGRNDTSTTVATLAVHGVLVGVVLAGIVGTQRRRASGRWIGVVLLGLVGAIAVYSGVQRFAENLRRGDTLVCGIDSAISTALLAIFALWIHRSAFCPRARAWYDRHGG